MCRRACLMLTVVFLVYGCSRKDAGSEPQGRETQETPPERVEVEAVRPAEAAGDTQAQETTTEAGETEHPIVTMTRRFLHAIVAGQYDQALALCAADSTFTAQGLTGMNVAFQLDQAAIGQAWLGTQQAVVITGPIPAKQGSVTGFWGFILVATEDGGWAMREGDFLPNEQVARSFFDRFLETEPEAESIEM